MRCANCVAFLYSADHLRLGQFANPRQAFADSAKGVEQAREVVRACLAPPGRVFLFVWTEGELTKLKGA